MPLINSKEDIRRFVFGGNAIFTLENRLTGGRFTFRVKQKKAGDIYWVSLLNGPDNTSDYRFFGTIFPPSGSGNHTFRHSTRGQIGVTAPSAKAWKWFFDRLSSGQAYPIQFEFHHAGRCGRCGRQLTVPESLRSGFGPECVGRI